MLLALLPGIGQAVPPSAQRLADAARTALNRHRHAELLAREDRRAQAARAALLAERQVQAAANLRGLEAQTATDAEQLSALSAACATASQHLATAEAALEQLLPAMQRLAAQPAETLLATPLPPREAVQGIAILQGVARAIAARALQVQTQSAHVLALQAQAQATQTRLAAAVATQQTAEAALNQEIDVAQAAEMADASIQAREAEASLAAEHKLQSINAAVAGLVPQSTTPVNLPAGSGGAPVAGRIIQGFGAATLAGPAEGVSYGAAPGARVISPCAGTVMFAGAFPAYGLMVITDCGDGTSVVLAGMHHLDVATGERLAHGQPVGSMLGYNPAQPTRQPVLYVELRQNGAPVDPQPWLAGAGTG